MSEIWDCYDRDFNKVEGKELLRDEEATFSPDEYHLVCDIAVKHTDGTYLLMQRDYEKKTHPGEWEFTAGGSALKGEDPVTCAKRELFEETGLTADTLREVGRMRVDRNHAHYVIYVAEVSCKKYDVILQENETIRYMWVTKKGLLEVKDSHTFATWRIFEVCEEL